MFYSTNVLQKKGPLGTVWIAAHNDVQKKLTKLQILNTDISATADQIDNPSEEMALRLSSHLLVGLSRIYTRKVQLLFTDCNEALSKITLAFRPSTVDLGPVSKAQVRAITMDEPAGISALDLDLDLSLDLDPNEWLASGSHKPSQASAADITLPDTGPRASNMSSHFQDEDPLLFGAGPDAGENPLDVNYDVSFDTPEILRGKGASLPHPEEDPEIRRDSDARLSYQPEPMDMDQGFEAPELPDFDIDQGAALPHALARPSAAHSAPGDVLATPMRSGNESGMLEFETPVIEIKKGRQARKRRANVLDESTEIPKTLMRKWIMEPESVNELLREAKPLPKSAKEAQRRQNEELLRKGKFVEIHAREPLSGLMGPSLRKMLASMGSQVVLLQQVAPASSARKRKASQEEEGREEGEREMGDAYAQGVDAAGAGPEMDVWEAPDVPQFDQPDEGYAQDQQREDEYAGARDEDRQEARVSDSVFGEYVKEDEEGEEGERVEEGLHGKVTEQAERTKKVIVMLQKSFTKGGASKPLQFHSMIKGSAGETPSRHTAAVAFFELLGLQAKGMVKMEQPEAFGEITIGHTPLLLKQKV